MWDAAKSKFLGPLIGELGSSAELIGRVPEHIYRDAGRASGSVGAHVRHNLDFVTALLRGLRTGMVDYADRERDSRIEKDRRYALSRIEDSVVAVAACSGTDPGTLLVVRSEVLPDVRHRSSFSREVEYVYSHMVHHHALINERLAAHGLSLPNGFGVAPSTRVYRDRLRFAA